MVSKNTSSDWPPSGWKIEIKRKNGRKTKCYINSNTHQKLYSKTAVLRHINNESVNNGEIEPSSKDVKKSSGKIPMQLVEANELQWLPTGWVLERRIRKSGAAEGTEYKCYIDPSTGATFYSKPEVLRYLKSKQCHPGSSRQKDRRGNGDSSSKNSVDPPSVHKSSPEPKVSQLSKAGELKVVIERTIDQDLPSGWVKESRIKVIGDRVVRRDPFYLDPDPSSRLVFRSKLEAQRYLETGEISRHAYRRREGSIIGKDVAIEMTPTSSSGKREEISKSSVRKELCAGESSSEQSIPALPEDEGYEKAGGKKSKRSPSGVSSSNQTFLSPKSVNNSQDIAVANPLSEKVSGKRTVTKTKDTAPEGPDAVEKCATFNQSKPSPGSRGILSKENPVDAAIQGCSNGKAQASKRKTKDTKLPSVPSRSSKRLAGGDAPITSNQIAIEYAHRTTNRISSRIKPIPSLESVPKDGKDGKLPSVPSRSSKRLAGVDAPITFHPIPIEHARQARNRKSSHLKPIPSLESVPNTKDSNEHDLQSPSRKTFGSKADSCLASIPNELQEKSWDVDMQNLPVSRKEEHCTPDLNGESFYASQGKPSNKIDDITFQVEKGHTLEFDTDSCLTSVPNELQDKSWDVDMQNFHLSQKEHCTTDVNTEFDLASQGTPSNKISDVTSQVEKCQRLDFGTDTVVTSQGEPSKKFDDLISGGTDTVVRSQEPSNRFDDLISEEEKHCILEVNSTSMLATQEEPLNKLGDWRSPEDKLCTLYVDRETVVATQGEPSIKIEDLTTQGDLLNEIDGLTTQGELSNKIEDFTKNAFLVDLNFLQLEQAPPGFSEDAEVNAPSTTLKQSLEHPMDTVRGSKIENSCTAQPILEEQLGSIHRETEQPPSDLCFSSPLWSDPCLEFAYKTLTGSIPFDDNLAIQDYIQHQLRTSEEGGNDHSIPDIRAPSILRNDDAKMMSQLPEEVKFSNLNGFGSQEINQVKDK